MSFTEADKKKIEALYTIYGKTMYNVAYRILKDESLAVFEYTPYPNGIMEDTYCFKADRHI